MTLLKGVWLLLCTGNALGQGASQKPAPTFQDFLKGCGYSPLQLESDSGHLFIRGKIGAKKCRLLVDTGCTVTRLDPELVPGLKTLKELNAEYDDPFVKQINPADVVLIPVLKFSSGEFRNQPAVALKMESDYISSLQKAILGSDFLNRNHAIIDYLDATLWVRAGKAPVSVEKALAETLRSNGFANASLALDYEPGLSCKGAIDGHDCKLAVDTGAVWTLLDREQVKRWGLKLVYRPREVDIIGIGEIGSHGVQEAQLRTFQVGTLSVTNMYIGIADMSAWRISSSNVCGLIGAETLATRGALIDYSSRTLWLQRHENKY